MSILPETTIEPELTITERNAILAGLRLLQLFNAYRLTIHSDGHHMKRNEIEAIADDSGDVLSNDEIDKLCEELNSQ